MPAMNPVRKLSSCIQSTMVEAIGTEGASLLLSGGILSDEIILAIERDRAYRRTEMLYVYRRAAHESKREKRTAINPLIPLTFVRGS